MATAATQTHAQEYQYEPVSTQKRETRILTLQPGRHDDNVHVQLNTVDLDQHDVVECDALSYVWGSPDKTHSVTVVAHDGRPLGILRVTQSLDTALRSLRFEERPRSLWIDAISINQDDIPEKNRQVQWMDQVYKKARRVVVFLGPESGDSRHAMDILSAIGESVEITWSRYQPTFILNLPRLPDPDILGVVGPLVVELRQLPPSARAVVALLKRPWFTRLWVIQEVRSMRDKSLSVLQCGSQSIPWDVFSRAVIAFHDLSQANGESHSISLTVSAHLHHVKLMMLDDRKISIYDHGLLHWFRCSDPRDRLYGVLSLVRDALPFAVVVDYTRPVEDIFLELQRHEIQVNGLHMLDFCHLDARHSWGAPSWVPNQHSSPSHSQQIQPIPTRRFTPRCEFVGDRGLRVRGSCMDVVRSIVECPPLMPEWSPSEGPAAMLDWIDQFVSKLDANRTHTSDHTIGDRVAHRLLQLSDLFNGWYGDTKVPAEKLSRRQAKAIIQHIFLSQPPLIQSGGARARALPAAVAASMRHFYMMLSTALGYDPRPALFTTAADDLGYGPAAALPGDCVCAVFGCDDAMLLRPAGGAGAYVVVGPGAIAGGIRCEAVLGPLPGRVFLALNRQSNEYTFWDVVSKELLHDPRLDKFGLGEMVRGHGHPFILRGDIDLDSEGLNRRGIRTESFLLV